jgi:hypothetical protein
MQYKGLLVLLTNDCSVGCNVLLIDKIGYEISAKKAHENSSSNYVNEVRCHAVVLVK